ncbi:energy transducer TonB [Paraurantiacibacter namhicola]|uniref:Gram-negative bacterial tonB protein n=1 Tax=Paraurantiacibacter namhicola TaxID=645517 RepID=A0A1C7D849_9SPHN|nr:energy transducer TonB [Paraurantiacibacter namhicola]ANU07491.1 Gram-negative bacterial tonB protein [Paraurantiacibacter namhicola]
MAYIDQQQDNSRRTTAAVAVIAIHAALGYAVVSGLAMEVIEQVIDENPDGVLVLPPPPPPPPKDELVEPKPDTPTSPEVVVPVPPIPLPNPNPMDSDIFDPADVTPRDVTPIPLPDPGPPIPPARPEPKPQPSFAPVAAKPLNDQAGWVTTNDYPSRDLREGNEGTARYSLSVTRDGRVGNCSITRSSGHPGLDRATCKAIERRARFNAAIDNTGAKVSGNFTGTVTWRIPK